MTDSVIDSPAAVLRAAEVVQRCRDEACGVPAAIARNELLRSAPAPLRAQVARIAVRAIGGQRRLAFALGRDNPSRVETLQLCGAAAVELLLWPPEVLCAWLAKTGHRDLQLPSPADLETMTAAIADPSRRMLIEHSVPDWMLPRLAESLQDDLAPTLRALGQPAPRTVRTNLLRVTDREALLRRFAVDGITAEPARFAATALHVLDDSDLFASRAYRDGCFEQQDEASQLCVAAVAPPPGGKVLDLCSGSGGKTLAIAAALQNRGQVLAADISVARIAALQKRIARTGADNVQVLHLDGTAAAEHVLSTFAAHADRILVDAPCGGSGSWRRRPEARWLVGEADLARLQTTQRELLLRAAGWLRPGARLVFATCSLLREENVMQVEWLLQQPPLLTVMPLREVLGGEVARPIADGSGTYLSLRPDLHGCDGFFAAILRRPRR